LNQLIQLVGYLLPTETYFHKSVSRRTKGFYPLDLALMMVFLHFSGIPDGSLWFSNCLFEMKKATSARVSALIPCPCMVITVFQLQNELSFSSQKPYSMKSVTRISESPFPASFRSLDTRVDFLYIYIKEFPKVLDFWRHSTPFRELIILSYPTCIRTFDPGFIIPIGTRLSSQLIQSWRVFLVLFAYLRPPDRSFLENG